MLVDPEIDVNT